MALTGRISSVRSRGTLTSNNLSLNGNINSDEILSSNISSNEEQLDGSLNNIINYSVIQNIEGTPYMGPYNFIPSVYNVQTGNTAGKVMTQDVTVQKIPQYEVSNPQGGLTLTIGEL